MKRTIGLASLSAIVLAIAAPGAFAQGHVTQTSASLSNLTYSVIDLTPTDGLAAGVTFQGQAGSTPFGIASVRQNDSSLDYAEDESHTTTFGRLPFATSDASVGLSNGNAAITFGANGNITATARLSEGAVNRVIGDILDPKRKSGLAGVSSSVQNYGEGPYNGLDLDYNFVLAPYSSLVFEGLVTLSAEQSLTGVERFDDMLAAAAEYNAQVAIISGARMSAQLTLDGQRFSTWPKTIINVDTSTIVNQPLGFHQYDGVGALSQPFSLTVSNNTGEAKAGQLIYSLTANGSVITSVIPEPATWASFALGLGFLGAAVARQRKHAV